MSNTCTEYLERLDSSVRPELNAFLVMLSHLTVDMQRDILQQATSQISQAVEQTLNTIK